MFWHRPRLPVDFYFPTLRSTEVAKCGTSTNHVDEYIATVWDQLSAALHLQEAQSTTEAQRQKWYNNWKIGSVGLMPGNLILFKADAFKARRKIKDRWEDHPHEVVHQITTDIPLYEVKDQHRHSHVLHHNWLLLVASETVISLCVGLCQVWDKCTSPTPVQSTARGEWQQDYTTRRWWSGYHPMSG